MTLNDESLLTAYVDGELDADQRSAVESALLADPELARDLSRLETIRDLVAGLSRPALPADMSAAVLARIGPPAFSWPGLGDWLRSPRVQVAAGASGVLALAATVLLALALPLHTPRFGGARPAARPAREVARAAPDRDPSHPDSAPAPVVASADESGASVPAATPGATISAAAASGGKRNDPATSQRIRTLLESPHLRRVLIVTDVIGGGTSDRVEELVKQTPRTDATYGRITVSQGIVIDPLHPREATVFALVMNDQERRHFQRKLEQAFPERVEDTEADPVVVSQLADVGRFSVLPGTRASEVIIPGDVSPRVALRTDPSGQGPAVETSKLEPAFGLPDLAAAARLTAPGEGAAARSREAAPGSTGSDPASARDRNERPAGEPAGGLSPASRGPAASLAGTGGEGPRRRTQGTEAAGGDALSESFRRAVGLHEPPEIVLVWVTPR